MVVKFPAPASVSCYGRQWAASDPENFFTIAHLNGCGGPFWAKFFFLIWPPDPDQNPESAPGLSATNDN